MRLAEHCRCGAVCTAGHCSEPRSARSCDLSWSFISSSATRQFVYGHGLDLLDVVMLVDVPAVVMPFKFDAPGSSHQSQKS